MPTPDTDTLDPRDLAHCQALLAKGSKSFALAARILPTRVRVPATVIYAFCRVADDEIDDHGGGVEGVQTLRDRLARAYAGRPFASPVDRALSSVVRAGEVPSAPLDALIEGFAWDVEDRRYETLADLEAYATRVAGAVGALMSLLMGGRSRALLARACDLGVAMQLTNVARDVHEDARRGRVYLPLEWLREAGMTPQGLVASAKEAGAGDPRLAVVLARLLSAADALYRRADAGIEQLPADCRPSIRAARLLYADIGRTIARGGYNAFAGRAVVSPVRKIWLLCKGILGARAPREGGVERSSARRHTFACGGLRGAVHVTDSHAAAVAQVREAGGVELVERLLHLDRVRGERTPAPVAPVAAPERGERVDVDVLIAGGGLWSLLAPVLAARGLSVLVVDRARVGVAHREWNASDPELTALVRAGLVSSAELEALIVARYRVGLCRFAGGGEYPIAGVLDRAVDAGALLAHGRKLGEARGVRVLEGHSLIGHTSGPTAVRVRLASPAPLELVARVLVDARGASSPSATADLVCPTVGGVLEGLAEGDAPDEVAPDVGDILATVDDAVDGRQHVWEAFPGRAGETAVYLFYYARASEPVSRVSLVSLYARFFATRSAYKRGEARLLRPTFGYIPGWSRLSPAPAAPPGRVVLVGDVAARHSPLTFCGFGAMLRSLEGAANAVEALARREGRAPSNIVDDAPIHALTGALAMILAAGQLRDHEANGLLDAAFAEIHAMGDKAYGELLRDALPAREFVTFLRRTARRHPAVWGRVARGLGAREAAVWGARMAWATARTWATP